MNSAQLARARRLLCDLQAHIRDTVIAARGQQAGKFARIVGVTAADTIYHVDRISETAILAWFEQHWLRAWPVELVMEGLADGETCTFPRGTPVSRTKWKCILDPIDGTRGLMYDKRSAWILAGLAPQRGARTRLSDIVVAAMTELPVSKQWRSDQFSAIRGQGPRGVRATWTSVLDGKNGTLRPRLSQARDCLHGFASFARFFPAGKTLLSELEEALWKELHPTAGAGGPVIFDDQYISSGGQLAEIIAGHDRFTADLRPLAFKKLGLNSALTCHPYDLCTALVLTELGGIVEAPLGGAVDAPLDTTTSVSWMGFANEALAKKIRPVLRRLVRQKL